jgi:site-specific recombinase XerD
MLLQSGVPIHIAKELAGHTDINTTAGYLRVWDHEQQAQIRKLRL